MKKVLLVCVLLCVFCAGSNQYTPTSDYSVKKIEGWKELSSNHAHLAKRVLKLLKYQLYQITRTVPDEALTELKAVAIWVEYKAPRHRCMCYHPSKDWLRSHGFNPEKKQSVEIANAEN